MENKVKREGNKLRLNYYLTVPDNSPRGVRYFRRKKSQLMPLIERVSASEWKLGVDLKVEYLRGVHNDGMFYNIKDMKTALSQWTEKDQLDFIEGGEW